MPSARATLVSQYVAAELGIEQYDITGLHRHRKAVQARQLSMLILREKSDRSLTEIGNDFGGMHRTTVLHSIRQAERLCAGDPNLRRIVDECDAGIVSLHEQRKAAYQLRESCLALAAQVEQFLQGHTTA